MAETITSTETQEPTNGKAYTRAELLAQLDALSGEELADVLSAGMSKQSKEARKATYKAAGVDKAEADRKAKAKADREALEAERTHIETLDNDKLLEFTPTHAQGITRTITYTWDVTSGWSEAVGHKIKGLASQGNGSINKRDRDPARSIFPGKLRLAGAMHPYASSVCKTLGIDAGKDSAARRLCAKALAVGQSLGVDVVQADGSMVDLLTHAKAQEAKGILKARQ